MSSDTSRADEAMERYAAGEDGAFGEVIDAVSPFLLEYLRSETRSVSRTTHVVRLTFGHVHRSRGTFISGAEVIPWALAISQKFFEEIVRQDFAEARTPGARAFKSISSSIAALEVRNAGAARQLSRGLVAALGALNRASRESGPRRALEVRAANAAMVEIRSGTEPLAPWLNEEMATDLAALQVRVAKLVRAYARESSTPAQPEPREDEEEVTPPAGVMTAPASRSLSRSATRVRQAALLAGAAAITGIPYAIFFRLKPDYINPSLTSADLAAGITTQVPTELLEWTTGGSLLVALIVLWSALSRGRSMLGRTQKFLVAAAIATPVILFAWRFGWSLHEDWIFEWRSRSPWGKKCLLVSLATALAPLASFIALRRRSDPAHPGALGALMGVSAGACSWVLVDLRCPVGAPEHLLVGHVLPIAILALLGALLGRWQLGVRAVA